MVQITFMTLDGEKTSVDAEIGDSIMQVAIANDIDEILGECGGSMMCATCHCYVDEAFSDVVAERSESEEEMLASAASEVTSSSRLSCQIIVSDGMEGLIIRLPEDQV